MALEEVSKTHIFNTQVRNNACTNIKAYHAHTLQGHLRVTHLYIIVFARFTLGNIEEGWRLK